MTVRLLVVDDEPDMEALCRQKFRGPIRKGELEISFVSNGLEALAALERAPDTDVVLTDLNMPEMDGLGLLARIQDLELPLRTVVVSAYGDIQHIRQAMNRGAFDFLTKPIEFGDLDATVHKAIQVVGQLKAGLAAGRQARELEEKNRFVREVFGRYVPDQVVAQLLEAPDGLRLGGQRREITTMMVDVRGFTALSERLEPEAVVDLLNRFLGIAVACIHRHGGTVNEILGDGLLVFFGAPVELDDPPSAAVAAAIELQIAMDRFRQEAHADGASRMAVGIGIHTAPAVVGNIGSAQRAKYTAVGSGVNLACRIESYTLGGQILISDTTLEKAGGAVRARRWGEIRAKGVSAPVVVHDVLGFDGDVPLVMPSRAADRACLPSDVRASVHLIDGKAVSERAIEGQCIRLSDRLAIVRAAERPPAGASVQLALTDAAGARSAGQCHGKVELSTVEGDDLFVVHITYADPSFLDTIEAFLAGVGEDVRARRSTTKGCEDRPWCRACGPGEER